MDKSKRKEFIHRHKQQEKYSQWAELKTLGETPWDDLTDDQIRRLDDLTRPEGAEPFKFDNAGESRKAEEAIGAQEANQPIALGFDPSNSSMEYLDQLRSEAFARGGENDADFQRYNQLYTEKLYEANKAAQGYDSVINHEDKIEKDPSVSTFEEQFDEAIRNNASIEELSKIRRQFYKEGLSKSLENGDPVLRLLQEDQAKYDIMNRVISELRESQRSVSELENSSEIKRPTRLEKLKKIGKRVLYAAAAFLTLVGVGKSTVDNQQNSEAVEPRIELQSENISSSANEELNAFISFSQVETNAENLNNNGRYDRENDSFYKFDNKESRGSIGESIESVEDFTYINHLKNNMEDNVSFKGQFFRMNQELAQELLGMNSEEVEKLVDDAEKGDSESFNKLHNAYANMMNSATLVEGKRSLGEQFDSIYRIQEDDGTWTYKQADDLNIGGTYRTISVNVNGKNYMFDVRDNCTQLVVREMMVTIPPITPTEYSNFIEPTPPVNTETPPGVINETPENKETPPPPKEDDTPGEIEVDSKNPSEDMNVNPHLNQKPKSEVKDNATDTNEGNGYEHSAQDADQNMIYGSENYVAPPVENFAESPSSPETGTIIDNTGDTYNIEVNYGNEFKPATSDVNIDDSTEAGSLNGASDQNGSGSNSERVGGF